MNSTLSEAASRGAQRQDHVEYPGTHGPGERGKCNQDHADKTNGERHELRARDRLPEDKGGQPDGEERRRVAEDRCDPRACPARTEEHRPIPDDGPCHRESGDTWPQLSRRRDPGTGCGRQAKEEHARADRAQRSESERRRERKAGLDRDVAARVQDGNEHDQR